MKTTQIPTEAKAEALRAIEMFNRKELRQSGYQYVPRFRGKFLYLAREEDGNLNPILRLEWAGPKQGWLFAIYKYSRDCYDPEEFFFPGAEFVDGTVAGALEAGMHAYP